MEDAPPLVFRNVALALANEGVPLRVISRAIKQPAPSVRQAVQAAISDGTLVEMPGDDWPPGVSRSKRGPSSTPIDINSDRYLLNLVYVFKVTKLWSRLLAALIHRPLVDNDMAHRVLQQGKNRSTDEESKSDLVKVVICHLRKRLKPLGIEITTSWSCGYFMEPEMRKRALEYLEQRLHVRDNPQLENPLPCTSILPAPSLDVLLEKQTTGDSTSPTG